MKKNLFPYEKPQLTSFSLSATVRGNDVPPEPGEGGGGSGVEPNSIGKIWLLDENGNPVDEFGNPIRY